MNFLHVLRKYSTKILLISVLIVMMILSVTNFNKNYAVQMKLCENLDKADKVSVKISSFPVIKNDKLSFEGIVLNNDITGAVFNISLKSFPDGLYEYGDVISLTNFAVFPPEPKRNEGGFDSVLYFKSRNICGNIYSQDIPEFCKSGKNHILRYIGRFRQKVINGTDAYFKPAYSGIVKALITGERYGISDETENNFKYSGVYHIIAISGLHLNIFIMLISKLIASLKIKRRNKAIISGVICSITALFVLIFTGFGLSVVRAFVMLAISLGSGVFSRKYSGMNALLLAGAIIVIVTPASYYSTGFILSVLSTLAVLISAKILRSIKEKENLPRILKGNIASVFITSVLCTLFTLPVMMKSFYFIPLYSAFANFIILPAVSPALIMSLIFCIFHAIGFGFAAKITSYCVTALVHYIDKAASITASLPFARINLYPLYTLEILILMVCCGLCIYCTLKKLRRSQIASAIIFTVAVCSCLVYNSMDKDVKLIFADVGQGDCTIIRLPDGSGVMVDCGSADNAEYIGDEIRNTLIKNNIRVISAAFVSHYHSDHVSEIAKLTDDGYIKNLYIPHVYNKNDKETVQNHDAIIYSAQNAKTKVSTIKAGDKITIGKDCVFDVLLPVADMYADDNNMSAVIKFTYGNTSALFTGDIEKDVTGVLCSEFADCDILKVPHHGGKSNLTDSLIKAATPDYALIGCGKNNIYKHPHTDTIKALENCGAEVYRTDTDGSVTIALE